MNQQPIYFPGLNGLRSISAMAVVISHITLSLKELGLDPFIFGSFDDGSPRGLLLAGYGVSIFFVISGFLITYLLLVEKEIQPINIKKFYVRRALRIWPLYYLYFGVAIFILIAFCFTIKIKTLFLYFFFAANVPFIMGCTTPFLAHYWSIAVEEQFYLFWPWIIKKSKYLISLIIILLFILVGIKITAHFFHPGSLLETTIHITRFHCMLIGALGCILYRQNNKIFLLIIDNKVTQIISWLILFMVVINKYHFISLIDNEIISVISLFLIIGQIKQRNRIVNLELGIFNFLGKISYGIYVIHPILIFLISKIINILVVTTVYKYIFIYILVTAFTLLLAYISYEFFEKKFLKMKIRYTIVKSNATPDNEIH